jgi:hypothetical protein
MTTGKLYFYSFLLVLSVVLAYLYYKNYYYTEIPAQDLSHYYTKEPHNADEDYLNRRVKVIGQLKAYYKILGSRPVLEFKTYEDDLPVLCFFKRNQDEFTAGQIRADQYLTVKGKCLGIDSYNYVKGVKIEVEEISPGNMPD